MRGGKSLLCIRHGVTEMNVYLGQPGCSFNSIGFVDPGLFDTRLTAAGEALAASELRKNLAAAHESAPIELVVSSPLTRALKTAALGLGSLTIPRTVSPLIAERRYLSSEPRAHMMQHLESRCLAHNMNLDVSAREWG